MNTLLCQPPGKEEGRWCGHGEDRLEVYEEEGRTHREQTRPGRALVAHAKELEQVPRTLGERTTSKHNTNTHHSRGGDEICRSPDCSQSPGAQLLAVRMWR